MSHKSNMPEKEPEYEFAVLAPPFSIRKRKDKAAPEVNVQRQADIPWQNQGDAIIIAMAKRIQLLEQAAGSYVTAGVDRAIICKLGDLLLGSGKQNYSAEAVHRAIAWMVANDPTYFQIQMTSYRERLKEEMEKAIKGS